MTGIIPAFYSYKLAEGLSRSMADARERRLPSFEYLRVKYRRARDEQILADANDWRIDTKPSDDLAPKSGHVAYARWSKAESSQRTRQIFLPSYRDDKAQGELFESKQNETSRQQTVIPSPGNAAPLPINLSFPIAG